MLKRRTLLSIAAAGAVALVPATAVAATAMARGQPKSGTYGVKGDLKGSVKIHGTQITGFHGTLTKTAELPCGTGTISVLGTLKLVHFTGQRAEGSYNFWGIGHNQPSADFVQPVRVKIDHNGKAVSGSLDLRIGRRGAGDIYYNHNTCDLEIDSGF